MAMLSALDALSIDAMLPALQDIGREFAVVRENDTQLVVSMVFLGFAIGQVFAGPLSDSFGRKKIAYLGLSIYLVGSLCAMLALSFPMLLGARVLQGVGASMPYVLCTAIVRDQYAGRAMARIMSFITMIFILVPMIAPAMGQAVLLFFDWRAIFACYLGLGALTLAWFALRQPETLAPADRHPFSIRRIVVTAIAICATRVTRGYILAQGFIIGAFIGYLSTAQQIFQGQYGLGPLFPLYFATLAASLGLASFLNGKLVIRHGMLRLSKSALTVMIMTSAGFALVAFALNGHPPLWALMIYLAVTFSCVGILFGNLYAAAMEPLGHIAGIGASVVGSLATLISLPLATLVGQSYDGSVLPLILGFAILGSSAALAIWWGRLRVPQEARQG
ncbi:multidrug effflux MFS transporter [Nordella sp. HKS 07]|nr:multidrug effflux MFS transporter [Nordella sp. HKS 07]